jgi:hypothetical protein
VGGRDGEGGGGGVVVLWNVEALQRGWTRGGDVNEENAVLEGTVLRWSAFGPTSSASDD